MLLDILFRFLITYAHHSTYFEADLQYMEDLFYYFNGATFIFRSEDVTKQIDRACTELLP